MMLVNGIPGRLVPCASVFGVRPPDFAALGSQPSPLANDLPSLADRADAQWLWVLKTPLIGSGTSAADDDGGYELVDAADGTWTQGYRGLVMPLSGDPEVYEATITVVVGGGGGGTSVTLTVSDAAHGHVADGVTLGDAIALVIDEALHAHAADQFALTGSGSVSLTVQEALHAHFGDSVVLTSTGSSDLEVADALHAFTSDRVRLQKVGGFVVMRSPRRAVTRGAVRPPNLSGKGR